MKKSVVLGLVFALGLCFSFSLGSGIVSAGPTCNAHCSTVWGSGAPSEIYYSANNYLPAACYSDTPGCTNQFCDNGQVISCLEFGSAYTSWAYCIVPANKITICCGATPCGTAGYCTAKSRYYRDADGDSYGNPLINTTSCSAPNGYVNNSRDCNDANAAIHPGATEICNGIDDNCINGIDEGGICTTSDYYCDNDSDGYNSSMPSGTCGTFGCLPTGCTRIQGNDCNDANAAIHPGATEICNGIDDNCNGQIDEGVCSMTNSTCSGKLPTNANWNDNGLNGNFSQTLNSSGSWNPSSSNVSYSESADDCKFKCITNYTFDILTQTCIKIAVPVSVCSNITTETACNNAADSVIENSVPDKTKCNGQSGIFIKDGKNYYNQTSCVCAWSGSASDGQCQPEYDFNYISLDTNQSFAYGTCSFATAIDNPQCTSAAGKITTTYTATWQTATGATKDASCVGSTKSVNCPITQQLPFFGFFEFMISVISIVLIYTVFFRRR